MLPRNEMSADISGNASTMVGAFLMRIAYHGKYRHS